ncbi:MAG: PD40 domain-containing protein [Polyangiaceae bacterium]|nr:PD40 domain-containing protein [Polyangiaceae bacterium]
MFRPVLLALAAPLLLAPALASCTPPEPQPKEPLGHLPSATTTAKPEWIPFRIRAGKPVQGDSRERHLTDIRQLTFGGENAEAYWSPDGQRLIFQSTRDGGSCDQIYTLDLGSGDVKLVSTGKGKTTCSYFFYPKPDRILYASTHASSPECPPKPDRSQGYVWPLDEFDIYSANPDGSDLRPLITGKGYDAEATVAFDGSRMVFTSARDGDLELYTSRLDGSDIRRITSTPGYDGGAFFSPDSTKLVWRASRPQGPALDDYRALLAKGLVRPSHLEIMVAGADGQGARTITSNGRANFGPYFLPDSRRVIFSSDVGSPAGAHGVPNFDLFVVDSQGAPGPDGVPQVERITFYEGFDGFPMFSPDGQHLVFASNRFGSRPGETNLFVARWVE